MAAAVEVQQLVELWSSTVEVDVEGLLDFERLHRSFGYEICADAFRRTGRKLSATPDLSPLSVVKYACSVAKNKAVAAKAGLTHVNYRPSMETR